MSLAKNLNDLDEIVDKTIKEIHDQGLSELPDNEAQAIIDTMQTIEDKLANLLAEFGVEIGDERID